MFVFKKKEIEQKLKIKKMIKVSNIQKVKLIYSIITGIFLLYIGTVTPQQVSVTSILKGSTPFISF